MCHVQQSCRCYLELFVDYNHELHHIGQRRCIDLWRCGLYNYGVATVSNSTLSGNSAGGGYDGGAIYSPGYRLNVTNCTITGNSAARGGGIENVNNNGQKDGATITNCTITGNTATVYGGGIESLFAANTVLQNCIVYDNQGNNQIGSDSGPNLVATDCDVQGG